MIYFDVKEENAKSERKKWLEDGGEKEQIKGANPNVRKER
jgi:hypothetical protein